MMIVLTTGSLQVATFRDLDIVDLYYINCSYAVPVDESFMLETASRISLQGLLSPLAMQSSLP